MPDTNTLVEMACDALLFDLDGVLIDSHKTIEYHWRAWAERHQIDIAEVKRIAHGRRSAETIHLLAPQLDAAAEAAALDAAEAADTDGLERVEGAERLIGSIPAGAWAVATSGARPMAATRLAFTGLPQPPVLVTGQDVAHGKPDPEPYLAAAAKLGIAPSRCVVIEDAPAGIEAGKNAGMRVIAIASTHAREALRLADVICARLADIAVSEQQDTGEGRCLVRVRAV